jgi:hypothetical protein
MITTWLVTLLVASVPTDWDNSGRFQTDVGQVNGSSRRFHTASGASESRMACKRSGFESPYLHR